MDQTPDENMTVDITSSDDKELQNNQTCSPERHTVSVEELQRRMRISRTNLRKKTLKNIEIVTIDSSSSDDEKDRRKRSRSPHYSRAPKLSKLHVRKRQLDEEEVERLLYVLDDVNATTPPSTRTTATTHSTVAQASMEAVEHQLQQQKVKPAGNIIQSTLANLIIGVNDDEHHRQESSDSNAKGSAPLFASSAELDAATAKSSIPPMINVLPRQQQSRVGNDEGLPFDKSTAKTPPPRDVEKSKAVNETAQPLQQQQQEKLAVAEQAMDNKLAASIEEIERPIHKNTLQFAPTVPRWNPLQPVTIVLPQNYVCFAGPIVLLTSNNVCSTNSVCPTGTNNNKYGQAECAPPSPSSLISDAVQKHKRLGRHKATGNAAAAAPLNTGRENKSYPICPDCKFSYNPLHRHRDETCQKYRARLERIMNSNRNKWKCDECGKVYEIYASYILHLSKKHRSKEKKPDKSNCE